MLSHLFLVRQIQIIIITPHTCQIILWNLSPAAEPSRCTASPAFSGTIIWERKKIFVMHRVHPSYERKQVCDNELLVECSVLCDTKRFIYHNKIGIDATGIQQELQNLEEFLNNKLASHKKEK